MDIGKAFTFIADDPNWQTKLLIGGGIFLAASLLMFTFVGGIVCYAILFGYLLSLTRNVIEGRPQPLPEWGNWGVLMREGLKFFAVLLIIIAPVLILFMLLVIPGVALTTRENTGAIVVGTGLWIGAYCLLLPVTLLLSFILPIVAARLALSGSIGEALRLREALAMARANFVDFLLVLLLTSFVMVLIAQLGIIACFIGAVFTSFYALLVNHHLYGQAYRKARGLSPTVIPTQPPYPQPQSHPY